MDLPFETLHCHSTVSDGLLTPEQVLDACAQNKIGVVAFTDHDSLMKPETFEHLKSLNHSVSFISGIEISCDTVPEVSGKLPLLHVTGLFVDPTNSQLLAFSKKQLTDRLKRSQQYVSRLVALGFDLTEEDVLTQAQGGAVGRPHIVAALSAKPQNWQRLNVFYEELKKLAVTDPLRRSQLEEINSREDKQKWYVLVLTKEALHSAYVEYSDNPLAIEEATRLIRQAGGVALLAHWSYLRERLPLEIIEKILREKRLDGMETVYAFGNETTRDQFETDMLTLANLCDRYDAIQGGGGDFHKLEDFSLMIDPRFQSYAQRTKGMIARIRQKHSDLNWEWSSLP